MRQSFGEEAAGKVEEALEPVHLPLASPRDALGISVRTQLAFLDADDKVVSVVDSLTPVGACQGTFNALGVKTQLQRDGYMAA